MNYVLTDHLSALGLGLDRRGMRHQAASLLTDYDVRPSRPELHLGALSGGNQQKVLLAKWLHMKPTLLMLDEPTQGVDFGARQQIFEALHRATEQGTAILCASTDNEQLEQICDRIIVFARGPEWGSGEIRLQRWQWGSDDRFDPSISLLASTTRQGFRQ